MTKTIEHLRDELQAAQVAAYFRYWLLRRAKMTGSPHASTLLAEYVAAKSTAEALSQDLFIAEKESETMSDIVNAVGPLERAVGDAYEAARPALLAAPNSPYTAALLQAWKDAEARRDSLLRKLGLLSSTTNP